MDELVSAKKRTWLRKLVSQLGIGTGFFFRVLVGRLLVGVVSVVLTVAFIAYRQKPEGIEIQSVLQKEDGRLLSNASQKNTLEGWVPNPNAIQNGFVLIAHGLHDKVEHSPALNSEIHWMTRLQVGIQKQLQARSPDICLVDWENATEPYRVQGERAELELSRALNTLKLPKEGSGFFLDLTTIRTQAEAIGELVGFKLARAIRAGKLDRNQPTHFIGHSAGGFVVLHAAKVLVELELAPEQLHITMLDTPMPLVIDLDAILADCQIDYYCSSSFAINVPYTSFHENYQRIDIETPEGMQALNEAHSYAHQWYIDSIKNKNTMGFSRSPLSSR